MIKLEKLASIIQKKNTYIFECSSQTTLMAWIFSEPVLTCATNCTDEELGFKVYEILSHSKKGVPHPENWSDISSKSVLKAANVKSSKQLHEGSLCIGVQVREDIVILYPSVNEGSRIGFAGKTYLPAIELSKEEFYADSELVGKKVRECFSYCK